MAMVMDANKLTRLFAPLAAVAEDQPITIESTGEMIIAKAMDSTHVHVIQATMLYESDAWSIYVDPEHLMNAIKDLEGDVEITIDQNDMRMYFQAERSRRSFKLLGDGRASKLPALTGNKMFILTQEFLRHVIPLSKLDEGIEIKTGDNKLYIIAENEFESAEHWIYTPNNEELRSIHSAELLAKVVKTIKPADEDTITMMLGDDYPLSLEWKQADTAYEYVIAPRVP